VQERNGAALLSAAGAVVRTNPRRKETNMPKVRVRERKASPEELTEDLRRCLAAKPTLAEFRQDLDETQEMPVVTMAELVERGL
jgi:hypothetical protein